MMNEMKRARALALAAMIDNPSVKESTQRQAVGLLERRRPVRGPAAVADRLDTLELVLSEALRLQAVNAREYNDGSTLDEVMLLMDVLHG